MWRIDVRRKYRANVKSRACDNSPFWQLLLLWYSPWTCQYQFSSHSTKVTWLCRSEPLSNFIAKKMKHRERKRGKTEEKREKGHAYPQKYVWTLGVTEAYSLFLYLFLFLALPGTFRGRWVSTSVPWQKKLGWH